MRAPPGRIEAIAGVAALPVNNSIFDGLPGSIDNRGLLDIVNGNLGLKYISCGKAGV